MWRTDESEARSRSARSGDSRDEWRGGHRREWRDSGDRYSSQAFANPCSLPTAWCGGFGGAFPDGRIPHEAQPGFESAVERLLTEMEDFPIGEIFVPHPYDHHPDHVAMMQMVRAAVLRSGRDWKILYYPVWMWYHASNGLSARLDLKGAWRLDGRAVRAQKNAAIAEYLNAPKAPSGILYCGNLPWGFLWNFHHTSEVFFE